MFLILVLPSRWAAYPGTNIPGGIFQRVVPNGNFCLQLCAASATCQAFDFNANNGGCWFHTAAQKCNALNSAPAVYHAKKLEVCRKSKLVIQCRHMSVMASQITRLVNSLYRLTSKWKLSITVQFWEESTSDHCIPLKKWQHRGKSVHADVITMYTAPCRHNITDNFNSPCFKTSKWHSKLLPQNEFQKNTI